MKRPDNCVYNNMIECQPGCRNCSSCGWNPAVKEKRVREFLRTQGYMGEAQVKCAS